MMGPLTPSQTVVEPATEISTASRRFRSILSSEILLKDREDEAYW